MFWGRKVGQGGAKANNIQNMKVADADFVLDAQ